MSALSRRSFIPRRQLFGNPTRVQAQLSPDGRWLSWLASKDGVLNIWLSPLDDLTSARAITDDRKRGIRFYTWLPDSTRVLYLQDEGGTEDWHVHSVDPVSGATQDLTPLPGVQARLMGTSLDRPGQIAVGLNDRDKAWHDIYVVDVASGERRLVLENRDQLAGIVLDCTYVPRLASQPRAREGGRLLFRLEGQGPVPTLVPSATVEHEDDLTTGDFGFTQDGTTYHRISSIGRDTAALFAIDWATGRERLLAEHPQANISALLTHPVTRVVEAAGAQYLRMDWMPLDPTIARDLERLSGALAGEIDIADRTLDDTRWIVSANAAEQPLTYHLYERPSGTIRELFSARPELKAYRLAPMRCETLRARDGLALPSYLTLPVDAGERPTKPLPMVLHVHGGPWARDGYGFNSNHQWMADRGWAVLSVNFRGSTGFGKAFTNAGDREWGRRMHDDLLDAVQWAVAEGIADPARVAIMGASYGGYATLAALAFTPEVFCCGVDIVGPSNLETLLATIPPYWAAAFEGLARRVGDPRTEEGRKLLAERSPVHAAGAIRRPLLIAQGANDPRVKQAESDQIIEAMRAKGLPVTYVLFPEEGHGLAVPENRQAFAAITEAFLALHLGGDAEPFGRDLEGAKFEVREGAAHVPGLDGLR